MHRPRLYWLASGAVLLLVSGLGFLLTAQGKAVELSPWLLFDRPHDVLHAGLGVLALIIGMVPIPDVVSRRIAVGVGTFYLALGVLGSLNGNLYGYPQRFGWFLHLEVLENLFHLALGAWGAYVGTNAPEAA